MFLTKDSFARRLLGWYDAHRRDLPWRARPGTEPNPYHVLVSEAMLQQTQVATALPYFHRFLERFPTMADLASADEQAVLRVWQGLGYYSRARNLRAAAARIMKEHAGHVPRDVEALLRLPGVGRYTAGAVASIAFDQRAPIVDGNVARVLCRLDRIESDPRERQTQELLWRRAMQILPRRRVGDFNSAMMELGATVCVPRSPHCLICPVKRYCEALAGGVQDRIPAPRQARPTPLLVRRTFCIRRDDEADPTWLLEQRPSTGRWAGMWQFVTTEAQDLPVSARTVREALGLKVGTPRRIGTVQHALTHRQYQFEVYLCNLRGMQTPSQTAHQRDWIRLRDMDAYPLPCPHLRIRELLAERPITSS